MPKNCNFFHRFFDGIVLTRYYKFTVMLKFYCCAANVQFINVYVIFIHLVKFTELDKNNKEPKWRREWRRGWRRWFRRYIVTKFKYSFTSQLPKRMIFSEVSSLQKIIFVPRMQIIFFLPRVSGNELIFSVACIILLFWYPSHIFI